MASITQLSKLKAIIRTELSSYSYLDEVHDILAKSHGVLESTYSGLISHNPSTEKDKRGLQKNVEKVSGRMRNYASGKQIVLTTIRKVEAHWNN